jgi:hypothetical protein
MLSSHFRALCLFLVSAVLVFGMTPTLQGGPDKDKPGKDKPGDKDPRDNIPGARWEYTLNDKNGKEVEKGLFRAFQGKLFRGDKQIGTYVDHSGDRTTADFKEGKTMGTAELRLIKRTPATWKGDLTRADGSKLEMNVIIRKD